MSFFILGQFLKAISITSSFMGLAASLFCHPTLSSMFLLSAAHCNIAIPKLALNPPAIFLQSFFFLVYWSAIQLLLFSKCRPSVFYAAFSLPFILTFLSGLLFSKSVSSLHFFSSMRLMGKTHKPRFYLSLTQTECTSHRFGGFGGFFFFFDWLFFIFCFWWVVHCYLLLE